MSDSLWPHGLHSPWNSPDQNTAVVAFPFSRGSSQPRDRTQTSRIAGRFFTNWITREVLEYCSELPIPSPADLLTQELNWGLLHCRQILYQLSWQGSQQRRHSMHAVKWMRECSNSIERSWWKVQHRCYCYIFFLIFTVQLATQSPNYLNLGHRHILSHTKRTVVTFQLNVGIGS